MRFSMTSQQTAFFTKNGYIELAGLSFDPEAVFAAARALSEPFGRDLWRKSDLLNQLAFRKLGPAISHLAMRPVRLACDQWIPSLKLDKPAPIKDLLCVQGLELCALFTANRVEIPQRRAAALGIPPFASDPGSVLFVKPNIVLDWSLLTRAPVDLYLVAYAAARMGVYVHQPKDPATHSLKAFSYEFGDKLKDPFHPLLPG
jgi:hypothetical protein